MWSCELFSISSSPIATGCSGAGPGLGYQEPEYASPPERGGICISFAMFNTLDDVDLADRCEPSVVVVDELHETIGESTDAEVVTDHLA